MLAGPLTRHQARLFKTKFKTICGLYVLILVKDEAS